MYKGNSFDIMFSKGSLIVFLAVISIAFAAHISYGSEDETVFDDRGFLEEAKEKLKQFMEMIKNLVKSEVTKLIGYKDGIIAKKGQIEGDAVDRTQKEFAKLSDQLNKIKVAAEQKHQDISSCLKGNEDMLNNVPRKNVDSTVKCFNDKADPGLQVVQKSIDGVNGVLDKAHKLKEEFNACGSSILCLTKVIAKITLATVQYPATIARDVTKAVVSVKTVNDEYKICLANGALGVAKEGKQIINDITICISNLK